MALARYGESYTAARLLSELLALLDPAAGAKLAEETAQQLTQMGALASAACARATVAPAATEQKSAAPSG
jgi:hypothetical protein